MKKIALIIMALSTVSLGACQTMDGTNTKQILGTGSGALIGGVLGSKIGNGSGQLWATGAGALAGALIGGEIGKSLDNADQKYASEAVYQAQSAPIGEPISWNNPQSGNYGTITPVKDGYSSSGKYCREYQQSIYVGGQQQTAHGTACQQPDGTWQIVQ